MVSAENASSAGSLQEVAYRAVGRLVWPAPVPWVSVGAESGVPFTVVNGFTWFATHPEGSDCWHRYQSSSPGGGSQRVRAVVSIRWQVRWNGSANTSGSLPMMTTSAGASYAVSEAQALLNH